MKLYIKQKVFTFRDKFTVKNEYGDDCYFVEGELWSFGKQLSVYNSHGHKVAFIRQKLFSFMPRFIIEIGGVEICTVQQRFQLLRNDYYIDGLPLYLQGDFIGHEYSLHDDSNCLMELSKHWFTWGDSYELNIAQGPSGVGDFELLCLCISIAVDAAICVGRSR